uniref:Uncharacterized protein n=1 Tax=Oryza punctata TaxID=4537 RepID=A0A0E0MH11_ORYPU
MVLMPLNTMAAAILSLKREPRPTPEELAHLSPEERNERLAFADSWKEFNDKFGEFQNEIIRELKETGRYMVDESYFTEQAERRLVWRKNGPRSTGPESNSVTGTTTILFAVNPCDFRLPLNSVNPFFVYE